MYVLYIMINNKLGGHSIQPDHSLFFTKKHRRKGKGRIYSRLIMHSDCFILDEDLLNSALLV